MFTQISTGNRVEEAKFKAQSCKGGKKPPKLQQQQRYSNGKGCWSQCRKGGEKQRRAFAAAAAAASAALKALHHRPERGLGHTHSRCLKIER